MAFVRGYEFCVGEIFSLGRLVEDMGCSSSLWTDPVPIAFRETGPGADRSGGKLVESSKGD